MNPALALLGALPAAGFMALVSRFDARRPEPGDVLRRVTIGGAISVLPALVVEKLVAAYAPAHGLAHSLELVLVPLAIVMGSYAVLRRFAFEARQLDDRDRALERATPAGPAAAHGLSFR